MRPKRPAKKGEFRGSVSPRGTEPWTPGAPPLVVVPSGATNAVMLSPSGRLPLRTIAKMSAVSGTLRKAGFRRFVVSRRIVYLPMTGNVTASGEGVNGQT